MKTFILKYFTLIFFAFLFISCAKEDEELNFNEISEAEITNVDYSSIETEILNLVNNHRESLGLQKLSPLNIVSVVADDHTDYMIQTGHISHDNFDERAQLLMNKANAKFVAENVAYGYSTAESVLKGWLNSESHRKVIETEKFTHFGISTQANENGKNYFTQIFIKK